jgi:hypothetical protein
MLIKYEFYIFDELTIFEQKFFTKEHSFVKTDTYDHTDIKYNWINNMVLTILIIIAVVLIILFDKMTK